MPSPEPEPSPPRRRPLRWLLALYVVALVASHTVRGGASHDPAGSPVRAPGSARLVLAPVGGDAGAAPVRLVFTDRAPAATEGRAPVLLLHGSPGRRSDYRGLVEPLARERRVLVPDLPGFGDSERDLPDYSAAAHAAYCAALLEREVTGPVHVVGMSLGGAVALELRRLAPQRVASITLLSATGVQEHELLGDAHLNRVVHGLQLAALWSLAELVPHFGLFDGGMLSVPYARNFYDTDQRPLRGILEGYDGPMLVLHGRDDVLVPFAAAQEHARIVPQAELVALEGNHFLLFRRPEVLLPALEDFLARVDAGQAVTRAQASPERRAAAQRPFDPRASGPIEGFARWVVLVLAALATLVSEDLTCIGIGAMVGDGRLPFWPGVAACFVGIYVGDLLLFLAGRLLGRRALEWRAVRAFLTPERVERSSHWFERRGPVVIFLSRFLPGMRLPTYFASGVLRTSLLRFSLWFALAAALWTPILVWIASRIGGALTDRVELLQGQLALSLLATLLVGYVLVKGVRPMLTHRGRRLAYGRWRRLVRWEYWPPAVFYLPVGIACALFALRHRLALAFTAANPALPLGGVTGESKSQILRALAHAPERLARTLVLPVESSAEERVAAAHAFRERHALEGPLVVKPDIGERGSGVCIARDEATLADALCRAEGDVLVQEYLPGNEFGLFYARCPDEERGRLISIGRKVLPRVRGDGERDLERLILDDDRAVCHAAALLARLEARLQEVPAAGEEVVLGEVGSHCRGAAFLEGEELRSPALEAAVEELAAGFEGFCFGRFDVRAASDAELAAGRFRVLELNGVTSESAHVYDPRYSVLDGWRTMIGQWRLAYDIGAANARAGAPVGGPLDLWRGLRRARRDRVQGLGLEPGEIPS